MIREAMKEEHEIFKHLCDTPSVVDRMIDLRHLDVNIAGKGRFQTQTPMHFAAASGNVDFVRVLLKNGARVRFPVNGYSDLVATPLHVAAMYGHAQVCEYLLRFSDADVNAIWYPERDIFDTPLLTAIRFTELSEGCTAEVCRVLICHGARVNMPVRSRLDMKPSIEHWGKYKVF